MKRILLWILVVGLLVLGSLPAMASQFGGSSTVVRCIRC